VRPLYLIGLLRVHTLLGDLTLALKVMEKVDLNPKVWIFLNQLWYF
jgi:hypothetical protein